MNDLAPSWGRSCALAASSKLRFARFPEMGSGYATRCADGKDLFALSISLKASAGTGLLNR